MKPLLRVLTVGIIYIVFLFSFSFLDSIKFIDNFLSALGINDGGIQGEKIEITTMDPVPDPPYPPPPPPPGFKG